MSKPSRSKPYPDVNPQPKFPEIEDRILKFWKEERIFEESVKTRDSKSKDGSTNEFVFYDGPPFANGLPHYGHLLTGFVKDVVPRFQTMRCHRVERRFGWDCHGLPAEMEAEKELKISGRQQIQEFGIDKFNAQCRSSVLKYTKEWENYVTRQARWVSFENDYKTMDLSYMESVMWAFKELCNKGLVYEGFRVMPYSWACETPLSNFEIRLDNSYRPRQDPAISVAFTLKPKPGDEKPLKAIIWTTTPWTLPSNLALAVGPEIDYAIMDDGKARYIIAESALARYEAQLKGMTQVGSVRGSSLVERTYEPLFPYFKNQPKSFRILAGDFVTTEDGTGLVHMAPGFGEDDQRLCEAAGIELVCPVDNSGKFTAEVSDFVGIQVQEANKAIIKTLKDRGVLVRHDTIEHNYPHCWRTDTPLIYKAVSSWYVRVTDFRDRMVELNQQINWIPSHIRDGQFGKWLQNARDWSISRNRFWGTPIPVWRSDNPAFPRVDIYGSIADLERDFGVKVTDLHRPYIDNLVRPNPDDPSGKSMMRRTEEVFDCWFESGSMPFAQVHYPFENKEWFDRHCPADFIVEYIAQTRGWFYTMVVLGTALFDKPPFKNCMCHGVVLDEKGEKLSKRLKNYPDPETVFNTFGADALRWYLVSSPILKGNDLFIDKDGKCIAEMIRTVINPLWNAYYFFTLYANSDGVKATFKTSSEHLLDRYILSKVRELISDVTASFESYDLAGGCASITGFLDALNNWYIRRSRDRFWKSEHDPDKLDAYNTLFTVLLTVSKVAAPVLPLISEEVYRGLTGEKSVHLSHWPNDSDYPANAALVSNMDLVREVCSVGLSLREAHNLRTRLPLRELIIAGEGTESISQFSSLIKDELNVKSVRFSGKFEEFASYQLNVNARELGPRLGTKMKDVIKGAKDGKWQKLSDGSVEVLGERLNTNEFTLRLISKDGVTSQALTTRNGVVVLDTTLTPELEEEGLARDLVRIVQQSRKELGLHIADHIKLTVDLPQTLREAVSKHGDYLSEQTLSDAVRFSTVEDGTTAVLGGSDIKINIQKVSS